MKQRFLAILSSCTLLAGCVDDRVAYRHPYYDDYDGGVYDTRVVRQPVRYRHEHDDDDDDHTRVVRQRYVTAAYPETDTYYRVAPTTRSTVYMGY